MEPEEGRKGYISMESCSFCFSYDGFKFIFHWVTVQVFGILENPFPKKIGEMRPGSLTQQYKDPVNILGSYYYLSVISSR